MLALIGGNFKENEINQNFGYHQNENILYFTIKLDNLGEKGKNFKIDFYCFNNEYFLCLKQTNNRKFNETELPPKMQQAIDLLFPQRVQMSDHKCIQLMKNKDGNVVINSLKQLINN